MPGDYSRFTDDPKKRFSRVLMQQGRVQLDSDWNELMELLTRRDRMHILDVMGRAAIPRAYSPNGFQISAAGADLAIGAGHAYVDGILAEALPTDTLTYATQPFWPDPTPLASLSAGSGLAYLDVWEREITALEDPTLLEPALGGIDTTTRTQTVWQVRIAPGANCATDPDTFAPPSGGTLSTKLDAPLDPPDPCLLPESGGLRDVENRFYRLQVHGSSSPPKFKFSRDPLAARITNIAVPVAGKTTVTVARIGLDAVLRFNQGDWVEVTNDRHVLDGTPGLMAQIDHIEESTREIRLDRVIAATETSTSFPARLIRWDQRASATVTLDADGLMTATPGSFQPLESGIQVRFGTGGCRHGDTWRFATRVADNSVDILADAPPRATIHHCCALAPVDNLGTTSPSISGDCRNIWPPLPTAGDDCECAVCISADDHNGGTKTIQQAIVQAKAAGGKVCLKPGLYLVRETILIDDAWAISVTGHGQCVILFFGSGPVFRIERSADIVIEELVILRSGTDANGKEDAAAIVVHNSLLDVTIRNCVLVLSDSTSGTSPGPSARGCGVQLSGVVQNCRVEGNLIVAGVGVGNMFVDTKPQNIDWILGLGIEVVDNILLCGQSGVALAGFLAADVTENWILSGLLSINILGITAAGGAITIDDNKLYAIAGIGFTTAYTTVANNSITSPIAPNPDSKAAIQIRNGSSGIIFGGAAMPVVPEAVKVLGNRIAFMNGHGIFINGAVGSAMIKQNSIGAVGGSAIGSGQQSHARQLAIENNQIAGAGLTPDVDFPAAGICVAAADELDIAHNSIEGVSPLHQNQEAYGIFVGLGSRVRVVSNTVAGVRPFVGATVSAGIEILAHGTAEVIGNDVVWRAADDPNAAAGGRLDLLLIGGKVRKMLELKAAQSKAHSTANKGAEVSFLADALYFIGSRAIVLRGSERALVVRNNVLQMIDQSNRPLVEIQVAGTCSFGGNDCRAIMKEQGQSVGVLLVADTAIIDANHVFGVSDAFKITTTSTNDAWTVLGNIADGKVTVNNADLPADWVKYNRVL